MQRDSVLRRQSKSRKNGKKSRRSENCRNVVSFCTRRGKKENKRAPEQIGPMQKKGAALSNDEDVLLPNRHHFACGFSLIDADLSQEMAFAQERAKKKTKRLIRYAQTSLIKR